MRLLIMTRGKGFPLISQIAQRKIRDICGKQYYRGLFLRIATLNFPLVHVHVFRIMCGMPSVEQSLFPAADNDVSMLVKTGPHINILTTPHCI